MLFEATVFSLMATLSLFENVEALWKLEQDKDLKSHWDYLTRTRITDPSCECGKFDPENWDAPWNLFIHVNDPLGMETCVGTIVTSNLIVTSHKCLTLKKKKMRIYDVLKLELEPKDQSMATIKEITITETKALDPTSVPLTVVNVFFNPVYGRSSELSLYPENDMAIIKVAENMLDLGFLPICVPFYDKERIGNVSGFYYGYTMDDGLLGTDPNVPNLQFGTIFEKNFCHDYVGSSPKRKDDGIEKTLCFKFAKIDLHMKKEGGPLIYSQKAENLGDKFSTGFLMGVATLLSSIAGGTGYEASIGIENAYFSSIKHLIKYIEYFADLGDKKSVWCKTPKLKLDKMDFSNSKLIGAAGPWPWDELTNPIKRDDSLDCTCGIPKSNTINRIAGGQEATRYEYAWMVMLSLFHDGKEKGGFLCGGSVINDRVILTAAHCVVDETKIRNGDRTISIDPENVFVKLNPHTRRPSDGISAAVAAVLFHPEYFKGRAQKQPYFDADIAMLILRTPLDFVEASKAGLRPVCLPEMGENIPIVGKTATVAGWGLTNPNVEYSVSNTLQFVEVPIQDLNYCRRAAFGRITDNFICAGTLDRFKDAGKGDSGGPLMIKDPLHGLWYEVGIVSFGEDIDTVSKTAALYSDVQKLLPFVDYHSERIGAKWCKRK